MSYYIYAKQEKPVKKGLRLRPEIKIKLFRILTVFNFCLYLVGIAAGVDFETWLDVAQSCNFVALVYFMGVEV